jgi:hypothetical protein
MTRWQLEASVKVQCVCSDYLLYWRSRAQSEIPEVPPLLPISPNQYSNHAYKPQILLEKTEVFKMQYIQSLLVKNYFSWLLPGPNIINNLNSEEQTFHFLSYFYHVIVTHNTNMFTLTDQNTQKFHFKTIYPKY